MDVAVVAVEVSRNLYEFDGFYEVLFFIRIWWRSWSWWFRLVKIKNIYCNDNQY